MGERQAGDATVSADGGGSRRNSSLVSAGIALSRLAGFVRQRAMGHFFGAGPVLDAFNTAFRIPNILQNLLGEGVLSASFIPTYSRLLSEGKEEEAGKVAGAIAGLLALIAATLVVIGVVLAGPLTRLIAPGFTGERFELTVTLMRILFPGIGLLVLSAWCLGVLNSHRRFFLSYVAPVLWNVAQIGVLVGFGVAGLAGGDLVVALAWGTVLGGVAQVAVQLPAVFRVLGPPRLSLNVGLPGVRRTIRAFGPIVAGRGVVQLMSYVELALASLLAAGAVAVLGFAQQLYILPISLFGMAVAAAELPELSSAETADRARLTVRLEDGLARIAFYVAPSAVAFVVIGELIVGALYQSGAFGALDRRLVWLVLVGFSVGLLSNTSSRLLQSALYGSGDARGPAVIAALRVILSAAVGAVLMLQLDRVALTAAGGLALVGELPAFAPLPAALRDDPGTALRLGAVGLAVAAGASSWLEFALLRRRVARLLGPRVRVGGGQLGRLAVALLPAALVGGALHLLVADLHPLLGAPIAGAGMGVVYLVLARRLGSAEAVRFTDVIIRRLPGR
jgi:putative peptidoglycan lipid II flippase